MHSLRPKQYRAPENDREKTILEHFKFFRVETLEVHPAGLPGAWRAISSKVPFTVSSTRGKAMAAEWRIEDHRGPSRIIGDQTRTS